MSESHPPECYVHGIATAVPQRWLDCEQSAELLKQGCVSPRSAKLFQRIARLTGIEKRHLAVLDYLDDKDGRSPFNRPTNGHPGGPGMAARTALFDLAAAPLIKRVLSGFAPDTLARVSTLATATCTQAASPGLEQPIFKHSAVPSSAQRWNLGFMGCSAGLAAMRLFHRAAYADAMSLIVACELSSLHFQYTDELDQMTANVLFADGAAAMLLSAKRSPVRVVDCRCTTFPDVADQMVWFAGDHGLQLRLSQELPETLAAGLPTVVNEFLRRNGMSPKDVDHWLVHPGGPQILDSVEQSLGLPDHALQLSRAVLRRYGNMSSPTIFFIMKELLDSRAVGHVIALAFGPGLTIECVLLHVLAG